MMLITIWQRLYRKILTALCSRSIFPSSSTIVHNLHLYPLTILTSLSIHISLHSPILAGASLAAAQRRLARAHSRAASESAEADRLRARCAEMSSRTAEADAELRTERAVVERLRETRQREATALEEERKQHAAQRGQTAAELNRYASLHAPLYARLYAALHNMS